MQAHGAEIAYLFNLLAEIGGRRMFSHAKRRPASEQRGDGYEQRGCFSAVLAVPVRQPEAYYEHEQNGPKTDFWRTRSFLSPRFTSQVRSRPPAFAALSLTTTYLIKLTLYTFCTSQIEIFRPKMGHIGGQVAPLAIYEHRKGIPDTAVVLAS